jgi:hypothetical protein
MKVLQAKWKKASVKTPALRREHYLMDLNKSAVALHRSEIGKLKHCGSAGFQRG